MTVGVRDLLSAEHGAGSSAQLVSSYARDAVLAPAVCVVVSEHPWPYIKQLLIFTNKVNATLWEALGPQPRPPRIGRSSPAVVSLVAAAAEALGLGNFRRASPPLPLPERATPQV